MGTVVTTSFEALAQSLAIVSGKLDTDRFTAYGIFRNELFFAPAFLDHHRSLGVEQFLILDDGSDDGTREFLAAQTDCVVLASTFRFGDRVSAPGMSGGRPNRAGTLLKTVIPRKYLSGRWALYLDADEFLFLPPALPSVQAMAASLEARGFRSVVASLVDFYPANLSQWTGRRAPRSLTDLLQQADHFDARPIIVPSGSASTGTRRLAEGASVRLFRQYGIGEWQWLSDRLPKPLQKLIRLPAPNAPTTKQPMIHWGDGVELINSHHANLSPPDNTLLALAHFKFTANLSRRTGEALTWKSYARGSRKYDHYAQLLERVAASGGNMLGAHSRRFVGVEDFLAAQLMTAPLLVD